MCSWRHVRNVYLRCGHALNLPDELIACDRPSCRFSPNHPRTCVPPICKETCLQYRQFPQQYCKLIMTIPRLASSHPHDRRLSINIYSAQDLGPAVDESGVRLGPLIQYTEGNNFDLREISGFLSSSNNQKLQCAALQFPGHAAEWQSPDFTECMSLTFGPAAELVLDYRDIKVHCAALDTLQLSWHLHMPLTSSNRWCPAVLLTLFVMISTPLNPWSSRLPWNCLTLPHDPKTSLSDLLPLFCASLVFFPLCQPPPNFQIAALRVLEVSAGSSTYELLKAVADTFQFLIQPLYSPETAVQIAALKVLEAGAGTKDPELARAVKTIPPALTKIQSSGESDVSSAARKVLDVGSQNVLIGSTHDDV
ncbi:hypothetical protein AZE42_04459 [Rhizopogon vesiculosus]|uniref:Uncharacterized protein n=1 Tax=Rhizopogon vesiculosus TaxID=180088 RepID=A0A1J8R2H4_9AGAM|nr:hypothetical protein AZE42_04459 [Rhizopogon vesiculosus]